MLVTLSQMGDLNHSASLLALRLAAATAALCISSLYQHCFGEADVQGKALSMTAGTAVESDSLQADAFKKLYPREFFSKFIESGIRPDGRPVGRCRPTTVGLNVVSTADSSALVKIGSTTALAGVKLEVMPPKEDLPNQGQLVIQVEMTSLASSSHRPGRFSEEATSIQERINSAVESSSALNLEDLCIDPGRAAWCVYLDIYLLDAAGSLVDAALLAAIACLANMQLPPVTINDQGKVVSAKESDSKTPQQKLHMRSMPLSVTCGTFGGKLLVDPTAEEEGLLSATVNTIVDAQGKLVSGPVVSGGRHGADLAVICQCIEVAKTRHKEVSQLIAQQLGTLQ